MQSCFLRYSNSLVIQNFFWQRQSGCDSRSRPTGATATRCAGVKRLHQRNQRFLPNKVRGTLKHHLPNQTKSKLQTPAPDKKVPDAASAKKHCTYPLPARIMNQKTPKPQTCGRHFHSCIRGREKILKTRIRYHQTISF